MAKPFKELRKLMYAEGIDQKECVTQLARKQTTRLTIRLSDELDKLLRKEAVRRGTNINQTMVCILHQYIQGSN